MSDEVVRLEWTDLRVGATYVGQDGTSRTIDGVDPVGPDVGPVIVNKWDLVLWFEGDSERWDSAAAFAYWAAREAAGVV